MDPKERAAAVLSLFGEERHKSVPLFENCLHYPLDMLAELYRRTEEIEKFLPVEELPEKIREFSDFRQSIPEIGGPDPVYLWKAGNMPSEGNYMDNSDFRYNHDPDFQPYFYEMLIPDNVSPKGAIVVCAGGDHGKAALSEGYQVCKELNEFGYQCLFLLNRTNRNPYTAKECGADCARAIAYIRANAERFRVDPNRIAFAGFSNGGLTGECCIQYYSKGQTVKGHFPDYVPDELDSFSGAPNAFLCIYGPRYKGVPFDYDISDYPPTFFAVGREDGAMDNLNYVYPQLVAQGIPVEVHTFAGVPHGIAGHVIYRDKILYPTFQLWEPLADAFMQDVYRKQEQNGITNG